MIYTDKEILTTDYTDLLRLFIICCFLFIYLFNYLHNQPINQLTN